MGNSPLERRACVRFEIPGATVAYKKLRFLFPPKKFEEEFCPLLDISRGGIRFLTQKPLKNKEKLLIQISIPGERVPMTLKGCVRWSNLNPGKNYNYQAGIQFNPYGEKKDQNYPGNLVKIIALEQKFLDETTAKRSSEEYSI